MTAIASELDAKIQSVDAETARRLERLVRDAMELAEAVPTGEAERESRVQRLFAAMDKVKAFSSAGRLSRDELHAR